MRPRLPLSLIFTALIAAAPAWAVAQEDAAESTPIATVNGTEYSLDLFRVFFTQRMQETNGQNTPAFQEQAFNEFLSVVAAAQEADKRDLGANPDVQTALELQQLMIMSNAALQSIANDSPPTEDELKKAYEQFKEQAERTEYKARHILLDDQAKAEELIKSLDATDGKDFEKLARENSLGPTAEKGGDLGWFDARQMVKPFADAVANLEPGSYTEQPVQTQFGWHVILLEETRAAEPPSFEDAKPNLEAAVKRQKVADALNKLRQDAKVDLNQEVIKLKEEVDATE
ncbi:MAG: peptidylprolyl isomerase [Thiohalocapsa sp.]